MTSEQEFLVKIVVDCTQETITTTTIPDIAYTTITSAVTTTLSHFTSSMPVDCPIKYNITYFDPADSLWHDFTDPLLNVILPFATFTNTTLDLTLDSQSNLYAPLPINLY